MLFLARVVPALLAASSLVQASAVALRSDDGFLSGFLDALNKENLTILADNYKKISSTDDGKKIIDLLESREFTLLAPENCAFDPKQTDLDPRIIQYSTLFGSIDKGFKTTDHYRRDAAQESHSVAPSTFSRSSAPPATKRSESFDNFQVQVINQFTPPGSRKRGNSEKLILVDRPVGSATVVRRFSFKQIIILVVDTVLTLPLKLTDLLCKPLISGTPDGFPKVTAALEKAGLVDLVNTKDKITAFVPVDDSLDDVDKLSKDELTSVLENHFFFGQVVFTPLFPSVCTVTAQSGKELKLSFENGIHYVSCGKTKAVVLRPDVIPSNGVVHIIDRPLHCD